MLVTKLVMPPESHPVRECLDLLYLAEVVDPKNIHKLMTKNQIIYRYKSSKDSRIRDSIKSMDVYGLNELGQLELYRVSRFDIKTLWNFTTGDEN